MPPYRETSDGSVEVYGHRIRVWLTLLGALALTAACVGVVVAGPRTWLAWAGLAFFGAGSTLLTWRYARSGLLWGGPVLVLDGIPLNLLAATTDEVVGVVSRFYDGEIAGAERRPIRLRGVPRDHGASSAGRANGRCPSASPSRPSCCSSGSNAEG